MMWQTARTVNIYQTLTHCPNSTGTALITGIDSHYTSQQSHKQNHAKSFNSPQNYKKICDPLTESRVLLKAYNFELSLLMFLCNEVIPVMCWFLM